MIRLHNQNRTHTFIDVESGQFISLPKDETDKPPVNADINNNIDTFHSTGGEGTPSEQIPLVNVSEYNKAVTGQNLISLENETWTQNNVDFTYEKATGILTAHGTNSSSSTKNRALPIHIPPGTYTIKVEYVSGSTNNNVSVGVNSVDNTVNGGINCNLTSDNNYTAVFAGERETAQKYLVIYLWSSSQILNNFKIRLWLVKGSYTTETMPVYQAYQGNTYPYRLEDTDGNLHYGGDLPDGTADSVNWETGEFVEYKRVKVLDGDSIGDDGFGWRVDNTYTPILNFYINIADSKQNGIANPSLCSHFKYSSGIGENNTQRFSTSSYNFNIWSNQWASLNDFKTWLDTNNITVQYKLAEPVTYKIKQYGKTYGGVVWNRNEKPQSIQYHTNIFTDKNIDIQCEVRKLGNRAMQLFNWVTENGDKITTENGDYIMLEY